MNTFRKIPKPSEFRWVKNEQRKQVGNVDMTRYEYRTGYLITPSKPGFYDFFLALVPAEKLLCGRNVTTMHETKANASVECTDESNAVHKALFSQLKEAGKLFKVWPRGCPTVMANPWDVTNKGTGRFSKAMFTA
ncbi:hypothetical protein DFQ26_008741 [Actinomortierella ambigua]|nr:hypothetical protein DFQ26_008741 [Actinomortierella ambigua]